jgi:uncharacterized protein
LHTLFLFLAGKVVKRPVLSVCIALLVTVALISGVTRIWMATGNETFIRTSSEIYQNNLRFEEIFGGETIIVRFNVDSQRDLLTVENLSVLERLERNLLENENIHSVIGPATTITHMTGRQYEVIVGKVAEIRAGLLEMSTQLGSISNTITGMADKATLPDLSLTGPFSPRALEQMANGQKQLMVGIQKLGNGYSEFGQLFADMGENINQISRELEGVLQNPDLTEEEKQVLLRKTNELKQSSAMLQQAGSTMLQISGEAQMLNQIPARTQEGITAIGRQMDVTAGQLQAMKKNLPDMNNLTALSEGLGVFAVALDTIADGLSTLLENSSMMHPGIPSDQAVLDRLLFDGNALRPVFSPLIVDENNMIMLIRLQGNAADGTIQNVFNHLHTFMSKNPLSNTAVTITGKPVLDIALRTEMKNSMKKMVVSSLLLMVLIVSLVFKVRWRLLPLVVNFGAVVATMGLMGHVGIPMTMVSMASFPILIGLGIDYSIQFHNRYEEEYMSEEALRA